MRNSIVFFKFKLGLGVKNQLFEINWIQTLAKQLATEVLERRLRERMWKIMQFT